jgi:hypothetical protein
LRAEPDTTLVCIGAAPDTSLDVFAVADALAARGWYVDRQQPPPSIHLTVNAVHTRTYRELLGDLDAAVDEAIARAAQGTAGAYGTLE